MIPRHLARLVVLVVLIPTAARAADDVVLADFEGADYGAWRAEGKAFGPGPARGTLAAQMPVSGYLGKGLVNTYFKGDGSKGTLTSPPFKIERRYLSFLIGGGRRPGEVGIRLMVDDKPVRTETGADDERLEWVTWDVSDLANKTATIQIFDNATGGWGHVNVDQIVLGDEKKADVRVPVRIVNDVLYDETYRPQFHFTAKKGWLNDPNGLVYYKGEYHLFFQHNPKGNEWGNMTWGHALSKDLLRWEQLPNAIEPDSLGTIFSGSAVIDWDDTAGFGKEAMVAIYTSAGKPFTQSIAYSTDAGRTFTKYAQNPVLKNIAGENRDPKVFWHAPTKRWVMALYVDQKNDKGAKVPTITFLTSPNLKEWTQASHLDNFFECPDVFELPVDNDAAKAKWLAFGADAQYLLGQFDGTTFKPETPKLRGVFGQNFYAAQTYGDVPKSDGRRILIGWMQGGKYPQMPFNQQMSIPMEVTLRSTPQGPRMYKWPVRELKSLVAAETDLSGTELKAEQPLSLDAGEKLLDIECELEVGDAAAITFDVRGTKVRWTRDGKLAMTGAPAELKPEGGKIAVRLLIDRSSIEVFANGGAATMTTCFIPRPGAPVTLTADKAVKVTSMKVRELNSAWR